jgi:hypothetical protein
MDKRLRGISAGVAVGIWGLYIEVYFVLLLLSEQTSAIRPVI